jgi:hypothetical protein
MSKKQTRPYVKSVHSNLKSPKPNGDAWSVDLGRYTLLVGTNTSHKSSIIQSVELAVSGSVDDVVGRNDVKDADLLMSLCRGNSLHTTARFSDDEAGTFRVEKVEGKNKRPSHTGPGPQVLTHRAVKAALSGSAATRRKAFLGWIGGSVSKEDVYAYIPSDLHGKFTDLWDHLGKNLSNVDALIAINDYAAKQSRDLAKQRRGAEIVVGELIDAHTDSAPTEEDVERLEQAVKNAQGLLEAAAACANGMPESLRQSRMAECEAEMDSLTSDMQHMDNQIADHRSKMKDAPAYLKSGYDSLEWAVSEAIEQCPTCSSPVGSDHLLSCHGFFANQLDAIDTANAQMIEALRLSQAGRDAYQERYDRAKQKLVELANTPSRTDAGLSLEDARDRLGAASLALNNTMILKSKWDQIVSSKELITHLEVDIARYKSLKKVCDEAMSTILQTQSELFVKIVCSHLPEGWDFEFVLYDEASSKSTFAMGLRRGGILHEALSGAEWATVTTAISMAVVSMGASAREPAILIPEDRAWDGKTLSSVMRSFRNFEGQVIMASTIRPTGRAPAGWTIIDMDKESASWLAPLVDDEPEHTDDIRNDDVIRRPKSKSVVTTASAVAIEMMGYSSGQISVMTRETAAAIIKKKLKPADITIDDDGGYSLNKGGKVLNLPTPPSPTK